MLIKESENKEKQGSRYLNYLPGFYSDDEFMGQYLKIFQDIMDPLENTINNLFMYFDPMLTPEVFIPWMESWLNIIPDPTWTTKKRRELAKSAAILYRLRGTKRGLSEYLRIYTGKAPEISEYIKGMSLGKDTKLGINTKLGSAGTGNHFTVTIDIDNNSEINIDTVKSIIESQKPAHTIYTLQVRKHE